MADIKATLTRKIGPLPVWGWAAVVVGGVYVGRRFLGGSKSPATSILSGGGSSTTDTGFGESALPVDVTGRAATDVAPTPIPSGYDTLPIDYFPPDLGGLLPDPAASTPITPAPATTTAVGGVRPCSKATKQPGLGRYADAPNRECPQGWHLNRIPFTPCFGYCVQN